MSEREKTLRKIVAEHQATKIDGVLVDAFTASMLVQVLDNLSEKNQKKFLGMPIAEMADLGWRLVS